LSVDVVPADEQGRVGEFNVCSHDCLVAACGNLAT
jgi:hypothetical protein